MAQPPIREDIQQGKIRVRILLFSVLRERLGVPGFEVSLEHGCSTAQLLEKLIQRYPDVRSYGSAVRLAVNEEYVDGAVDLADGDEVALITPVSGG